MSAPARPPARRRAIAIRVAFVAFVSALAAAHAQTRILCLGDSITNGGQGYASYRYPLWFDLVGAGYSVDFVGSRNSLFGGDPVPAWYPSYFTTFDRDHEGYWGWRTDQIASVVQGLTQAAQPDIVLIHLGANDIGQQGAAGVANADANLRLIIPRIRIERPNVRILLAQIIGFGPGTSYFANAAQTAPLNAAIAQIASDLDQPGSRIYLVDQNSGFNLATMMQSDGLHPNQLGEQQMADVWAAALAPLLIGGNVPPSVAITAPAPSAEFEVGTPISLAATASDADGFVASVQFFAGATSLGADTTAPYNALWSDAPPGDYSLTAVATDDDGATRTSTAVPIRIVPRGVISVPVPNGSFEIPVLNDGALVEGPGPIGGWSFEATGDVFLGVFNPPSGSYPTAGGNGTPTGGDGSNAAYLFNNGPGAFVLARRTLTDALLPDQEYTLRAAIGRFLPNQPYAFSTYGGYRIELLAGTQVIATDSDTVLPDVGTFADASAIVDSRDLPANLLGQPLSVRLTITATDFPRSTHFDHIRITRRSPRGDLNCDGFTTLSDIGPFVLALIDPPAYLTQFPACRLDNADINGDGFVTVGDIGGFVALLVG